VRRTLALIAVGFSILASPHAVAEEALKPTGCSPVWSVVPTTPGQSQILDVSFSSSDDGWAVGSGFGLQHWDGTSWQQSDGTGLATNAISAAAPDDVWAVGSNGIPWSAHWDGTTWSDIPMAPIGSNDYIQDVAALGPADVWAVGRQDNGQGPRTLIEHWDGGSWSVVPSPNGSGVEAELRGVSFTGPSDVWAVGDTADDTSTRSLIEHWDGNSWQVVPSQDVGTSRNYLQNIYAASPIDAWAVGWESGPRRLVGLAEHWDGSTWQVVSTPSPPTRTNLLTNVAGSSGTNVWAVGEYYKSGWKELAESWNGHGWTLVSRPNVSRSNETNAIAVLPDGTAWAGGEYADRGQPFQGVTNRLCPDIVTDSGFSVTSVSPALGESVAWLTDAASLGTHTISDGSGMGLFDSGELGANTSFSVTLPGSGTYPFTDQDTGQSGAAAVPMNIKPHAGSSSTTFLVTWAPTSPPSGYGFDVQVKAPGTTSFLTWQDGVEGPAANFSSASSLWTGIGAYQFRARLRKLGNDAASGWSPVLKMKVT
jgi:hypothetical protein